MKLVIADLSSEAANIIPKSINMIHDWMITEFNKQKEMLNERFQ